MKQWTGQFYLKVCLPGSWLAAGGLCYLLTALVILAVAKIGGATFGVVTPEQYLPAFLFLLLLTILTLGMRQLHPNPGKWYSWILAVYATFFMASLSHLQTLFTMKIRWHNYIYLVTWRGKVIDIRDNIKKLPDQRDN